MSGVKIGEIVLEQTDSTNNYAKLNIENLHDKSVIIAKRQTAGRGRLNRSWIDLGKNNLFLSIVLKPSDSYKEVYSNLTQYLSVTLCKILEQYKLQPQIKWPNDVLINGKKISGILAETVMNGNSLKGIILGIGVNLNADKHALKSIKDKPATALNIELNQDIDILQFKNKLLNNFFKNYNDFLQSGFSYIYNDYIKRTNFLNRRIKIQIFNRTEEGIAQDINDKGELILLTDDNNRITLTIGDIITTDNI